MKLPENYGEILRYMGHKGEADERLNALICSSVEKLKEAGNPVHVKTRLPCTVSGSYVQLDSINIESKGLAAHLSNCVEVYIFAATLGAAVDRLIAQRTKIDSVEVLCIQACAAVQIEEYCNSIEQELRSSVNDLYLRRRFSPGYSDFNIAHQTDILRVLQAQKCIGLTETAAHMLMPLKSVTAVIGISSEIIGCDPQICAPHKCADCGKTDCPFQEKF